MTNGNEPEEYRVADNEKGRELLKKVGEKIEATGDMKTVEEDKKMIYITSYKVIEESDLPGEPEENY